MPEIQTKLPPGLVTPECSAIPVAKPDLTIQMPFGVQLRSIRASMTSHIGSDALVMGFLGQIQPALALMMKILVLASVAKTLIDCVTSIKDAVTSLSPKPIIDCLKELAKLIALLFEFIPPLNYIRPILDTVVTVISLLDAAIGALLSTLDTLNLQDVFEGAIEANPALTQYQHCIDAFTAMHLDGYAASVRGVAPFFGSLATLLDLVALGPLVRFVEPVRNITVTLESIQGSDVTPALAVQLRDVQDILRELQKALEPLR